MHKNPETQKKEKHSAEDEDEKQRTWHEKQGRRALDEDPLVFWFFLPLLVKMSYMWMTK